MRKVPDWNNYFMSIAKTVSTRSKDSQTQVGCVIVDKNNHIIATGYNGFKPGAIETPEQWDRPYKYQWVIHAEENAIANSVCSCKDSILYVTMFPCSVCAEKISAAGIKKVYYVDDKYYNDETINIFIKSNIKIKEIK